MWRPINFVEEYRAMYNSQDVTRHRPQQGFTLIELLITVTIVGILAAIAIPAYTDYTFRAQVTEVIAAMARDKTELTEYYSDRGRWPASRDDVWMSTKASSQYLVADPELIQDPRAVRYEVQLSPTVKGKIVLEAIFVEGLIYDWICRTSTQEPFPNKYLPASCR
jgi:type IV pilus assembly protein PilA